MCGILNKYRSLQYLDSELEWKDYMGSTVCDKEAEVAQVSDHLECDVPSYMTANRETFGTLLSEDRR